MMVLRSLASAVPHLPLFGRAVGSVGRLVEMCADDAAAKQHGQRAVLGGSSRSPATARDRSALGAADTAALARAIRLVEPARRGARLRQRLLLVATMVALIVTPAAVSALCHL